LQAKSEVLRHQVLAHMKKAKGGADPDPEKVEHGGRVIAIRILIRALMSLISQSDGIVASHIHRLDPHLIVNFQNERKRAACQHRFPDATARFSLCRGFPLSQQVNCESVRVVVREFRSVLAQPNPVRMATTFFR
jgi:hypothetical protein